MKEMGKTMELYQILLIVFAVLVAGFYFFKRFSGIDILKNVMLSRPILNA